MKKKIPLLFSDVDFGTIEYGFLPKGDHGDDDDIAYQRYLHKKFPELKEARVANGYIFVS